MKNLLLRLVICGGVLALSGAANATQYIWDLNKSDSTTNQHTFTFNDGYGHILTVYAYRSGNTDGSGKLENANVNPSGAEGLGVTSCTASSTTTSCTSGEDSTDSRLLDNRQGYDILVFDAGIANFDWNFLTLGSIQEGSCCDETPEIAYWTGNGSGGSTDSLFQSLCLTGGSCALTSNGFKQFQLTGSSAGTKLALDSQAQGRYLVVSGALDGSGSGSDYEKFKIKTVPTPETISLVGIGLLAMLGMRRRKGIQRSAPQEPLALS